MNLRFLLCIPLASLAGVYDSDVKAVEPQVAEISFLGSSRTNSLPAWVKSVVQEGGNFADGSWVVSDAAAKGVGRLSITIDRQTFNEDVALVLSCETADADLVVQLFDDQNRAIVLDVFGNVLTLQAEAKTDTFIVPLRKNTGASKIVLRRISGPIKISGVLLFPVVTEATGDADTFRELAKLLGDQLSPESSLTKSNFTFSRASGTSDTRSATNGRSHRSELATGIVSSASFSASSMNAACFAIVGIHQARFQVREDSVEVWLQRSDLYYRNVATNIGARQIESIKVGLASSTGTNCSWSIRLKSEPVPVNVVMRPEERQVLRDLHFTIPKSQTMDLSQHWLVFELLETHPESSDPRAGTTYAHSSKDVFEAH